MVFFNAVSSHWGSSWSRVGSTTEKIALSLSRTNKRQNPVCSWCAEGRGVGDREVGGVCVCVCVCVRNGVGGGEGVLLNIPYDK